jgi:hypothetical protein
MGWLSWGLMVRMVLMAMLNDVAGLIDRGEEIFGQRWDIGIMWRSGFLSRCSTWVGTILDEKLRLGT